MESVTEMQLIASWYRSIVQLPGLQLNSINDHSSVMSHNLEGLERVANFETVIGQDNAVTSKVGYAQ